MLASVYKALVEFAWDHVFFFAEEKHVYLKGYRIYYIMLHIKLPFCRGTKEIKVKGAFRYVTGFFLACNKVRTLCFILVISVHLYTLWCVGFPRWFDMTYSTNKFDKTLFTVHMKHIQTNKKKENYTRKLDQAEEI